MPRHKPTPLSSCLFRPDVCSTPIDELNERLRGILRYRGWAGGPAFSLRESDRPGAYLLVFQPHPGERAERLIPDIEAWLAKPAQVRAECAAFY